jgi:tRNA(Ile)-lysidine synthase
LNIPPSTVSPPAFDRRLEPASSAPIAVAFSGGGDSLAALILTLDWASRHGRPVIALCVDHRLQAASGAWTQWAGETAVRLGAGFRALTWDGDKPAQGLAQAARLARHRLIAEAAREVGARVVVFGHTADDLMEGAVMRGAGSTLGSPREWAPSPVWPQGRGVFLLRPLLGRRRAALREDLRARGERWIDDPANDDLRSARVRARMALADGAAPDAEPPLADGACAAAGLARAATAPDAGFIQIARATLRTARAPARLRFLAAAATCAGGSERPARRDRAEALAARIAGEGAFTATLAGARIVADEAVLIVRDAGEAARGGLAALRLEPGRTAVWDGRFALTALVPVSVRRLGGHAAGLDRAARARLRALPAPARPGLPLIEDAGGARTCPILAEGDNVRVRPLVAARLLAACAAISKEPAT